MDSLWTKEIALPQFERLEQDISTDVLIIGGGIAGLLCASRLHRLGVEYVLVEADRICSGVTRCTTAKITSQHGLKYHELIRRTGEARARLYLEANERAVREYFALCREIDCDFEERCAYLYSLQDRKCLEREARALQRLGFTASIVETPHLPFQSVGALRFAGQAQFHPLKFLAAIAAPLRICEHTKVRELIGTTAVTDHARIHAKRIVVATHFPFLNKHGSYFLKLYQSRSYVCALEGAEDVDGMYLDASGEGLSLRNAGKYLLVGGGGHRTGTRGGGWRDAAALAARAYPNAPIRYRFATQDCMTLDGMPYVGRYSARTDGLYVATGFGKWGMTGAMVAAELLADLLLGHENPYEALLSPSRTVLHPQLAINAAHATWDLIRPSKRRCPHMGCALRWNAEERSWDCPCHGSRFDEQGRLLDSPATDDLDL